MPEQEARGNSKLTLTKKLSLKNNRGKRLVKRPMLFQPADHVHDRLGVLQDERRQERTAENTTPEFNDQVLALFRAALKDFQRHGSVAEFFNSRFCRENKFLNFCEIVARHSGNTLSVANSQRCIQEFANIVASCHAHGGVRFEDCCATKATCSLCMLPRNCTKNLRCAGDPRRQVLVGSECAFLGQAVVDFVVYLHKLSHEPPSSINRATFRRFDDLHTKIMAAQQKKSMQ